MCQSIELTPHQVTEIFNQTFRGIGLDNILAKLGIGETEFWKYRKRYPLFDKELKEVRADSADFIADRLLSITDGCETIPDMMRARIQSDNIRSMVAWRNPQQYGNRVDVNVQHTIDLSQVLAAAESRVIPIFQHQQTLPEVSKKLSDQNLKTKNEEKFEDVFTTTGVSKVSASNAAERVCQEGEVVRTSEVSEASEALATGSSNGNPPLTFEDLV